MKLTTEQIELGATVLAIYNLGQDRLLTPTPVDAHGVRRAWSRCEDLHADRDGNPGIEPERKAWMKQLRKGDAYAVKMIKSILPWLFIAKKG